MVDYQKILLKVKKNRRTISDFTFSTAFFLIFSIFIIFAIRPNLLIAFELRNELEKLRATDAEYERLIQLVVEHQSILERNLTDLYVLDEAIPENSPLLNELLEDIRRLGVATSLQLRGITFPKIELIGSTSQTGGLQKINFQLQTSGDIKAIDNLLADLISQRRLKDIAGLNLALLKNEESTTSAVVNFSGDINSYYYRQTGKK